MENIAQNKKDTKLEKIPQNLILIIYLFNSRRYSFGQTLILHSFDIKDVILNTS